jgi:hypothetical protein
LVSLASAGTSPEVTLTIRRMTEIVGLVLAAGRPLAGALITAWPQLGTAGGFSLAHAVSGPDGRFRVEMQHGGTAVHMLVGAAGFATSISTQSVLRDETVRIELERLGGTLLIDLGDEPRREDLASGFLLTGGAFLPLLAAQRLLQRENPGPKVPSRLELPDLAPGLYTLCQGPGVLGRLRQGAEPPAARCSSVHLALGGEAVLELPRSQP